MPTTVAIAISTGMFKSRFHSVPPRPMVDRGKASADDRCLQWGAGCGDGLLCPAPGEQFVDPMDGVISDAREDIGQVGLRIDAVHPACFEEGVHAGRTLSTGVGAAEEVVLPAENRASHATLGGIIGHLET